MSNWWISALVGGLVGSVQAGVSVVDLQQKTLSASMLTNDYVLHVQSGDVAKPPQAYLGDPSAPLSMFPMSGNMDLTWGDYLGYEYELYSRTNLMAGNWVFEAAGSSTNATLPMVGNDAFYKVELVLQPEA